MDRRAQRDSAAEAFNLERGAAMLPTIRNILQSKGVEQRHTGAEARQMEKTTANRASKQFFIQELYRRDNRRGINLARELLAG